MAASACCLNGDYWDLGRILGILCWLFGVLVFVLGWCVVKGVFGEEKGWWFRWRPAALRALTLALSRRAGEGTRCWLLGGGVLG